MLRSLDHLLRLVLVSGLALVFVCGVVLALGTTPRAQAWILAPPTGSANVHVSASTGICTDTFLIVPGTLMTLTAHYNGVDRPVSFYLPTGYQPTQTLPLWFALHGGAQDASVWFEPARHTIDYAESAGFLLVMPNGLPRPQQPTSTNYYWGDDLNQDYIAYLMNCMEQQYAVDSQRIYAIGFSGGAQLAYQLAARPDISPRIAAIATAAGEWGARSTTVLTLPWDITDPTASGGLPLSALLLQGGNDQKSRLEGGFEEDFETVRTSYRVKVDAWRLYVGTTTTLPISLTQAPPRVTTTLYANLATGNVVVEAIDPILPHKWPDWNYMGAIVDFFNQVPTRTVPVNRAMPISAPSPARAPHRYTPIGLSSITSFTLTPGSLQTITLSYSNTDRNVVLYVPGTYSSTQVPLLMALHGGGQDASAMFEPSKHITAWAEAKSFIAVFPNGLPRPGAPLTTTNYFWYDDVNLPYLNYVMDVMMANAAIDRQRVYVVGFSTGANMTYRLASDRPTSQRIAAIATMAGHVGSKQALSPTIPWENDDPVLNGAQPTSALFLQGGEDTTHPELGGFSIDYQIIVHAFQTKVDLWRLLIGQLSGAGNGLNLPYAPPYMMATRYVNTNTGYTVVAAIDPLLDHAWPNWDLMGTIWTFFEQVPLRVWPVNIYLPTIVR